MGNAQPKNGSSTQSSLTTASKQLSPPSNGHSHSQPAGSGSKQQPSTPPYSLAYYSEALSRQELTPAFFLSSPLTSHRPPVAAASSSASFDLIAYADIARLLLTSNPALSLWRYKLVPARISEYLFWRCLFSQLDAQHPDYQSYEQQQTQQTFPQQPPAQADPSATAHSIAASEREIESLRAQIVSLQQQIAHLHTRLDEQQQQQHTSAASTAPPSASAHSGRWQPDKHTLEFFALDESLRATLRGQKEKRLDDVRREMRWIVDGDRLEEGPGRWDCCGKEEWTAEGCKR